MEQQKVTSATVKNQAKRIWISIFQQSAIDPLRTVSATLARRLTAGNSGPDLPVIVFRVVVTTGIDRKAAR
jgi:hypothetical protein